MQIDLYPAPEEVSNATEDFLDRLRQEGFQPTPSLVEGSFVCQLREQPWEAFLEAIQQWIAQRPGRHAQPGELKLRDAAGKDPTVTITIHRAPAEKAAEASA
jgi:hypothetical protein